MLRLFSEKLPNRLTAATGNMLDASRIGNLAGNHTYSTREIMDRAIVGASIVLGGYFAYRANNRRPSATLASNTSAATLGSVVGLVLGHIPVIYNIVHKRYEMKQESEQLTKEIYANAARCNISKEKITQLIDKLKLCSLASAKNSNASQTLGRQNNVLNQLNQAVVQHGNEVDALLNRLLEDKNMELVFKKQIELSSLLPASAENRCKLK